MSLVGRLLKAKVEPTRRFHQLYDKVYRQDILEHAYRLAKSQNGACGVDGVSFADIEAWGEGSWLAALGKELHDKTYRPDPVRRVMIPKPGGGERPLGIPTIRDRVVQTAAKLILEPIFEADFVDEAYGYPPGEARSMRFGKSIGRSARAIRMWSMPTCPSTLTRSRIRN